MSVFKCFILYTVYSVVKCSITVNSVVGKSGLLEKFLMNEIDFNSPRNLCPGRKSLNPTIASTSTTLCHDLCSEDSVGVQELNSLVHKSRHDALRVKRMLDRRFARED